MKEKITLPTLIQLFALRTGDSKKLSEDFLKEFFSLVAEELANGEQVKIKDLGVFKTIEVEARKSVNVSTGEDHHIPAHRKVVFTPCKELASMINAPFEIFETVELADDFETVEIADGSVNEDEQPAAPTSQEAPGFSDEPEPEADEECYVRDEEDTTVYTFEQPDTLEEKMPQTAVTPGSAEIPESSDELPEQAAPSGDDGNASDDEIEDADRGMSAGKQQAPQTEAQENVAVQDNVAPTENVAVADNEMHDEYDSPHEGRRRSGSGFWRGYLWGVSTAAVVAGIAYLVIMLLQCREVVVAPFAQTDTITASEAHMLAPSVEKDTVAVVENRGTQNETASVTASDAVPTKVSDPEPPKEEKVYDTITTTRYLTTMAKVHYGNFHLWPYIYEENKAFLGHPDRIKPGTRVVIPDLKKYGVDPTNPDDIAKAKKKGVEIYSRYK